MTGEANPLPPPGALLEAVERSDIPMIETLLGQGAEITETNGLGETVLHIAAKRLVSHEVMEKLLALHPPLDAVDHDGLTPLLRALQAEDDNRVAALQLINAGAAIEKTDRDGNTPLMVAAMNGNVEMVGRLIAKGAVLDAVNYEGQTASDLASQEREDPGMTGALRGEVLAKLREALEDKRRKAEALERAVHKKATDKQAVLRKTHPKVSLAKKPHVP